MAMDLSEHPPTNLEGLSINFSSFQITEMLKVRNHLMAVGIHIMVGLMGLLLSIPFLRKLARRHVYQPGDGPTKEQYKNDRVEYRGVAKPDVQTPNPPTAFCKVAYEGSAYQCG